MFLVGDFLTFLFKEHGIAQAWHRNTNAELFKADIGPSLLGPSLAPGEVLWDSENHYDISC